MTECRCATSDPFAGRFCEPISSSITWKSAESSLSREYDEPVPSASAVM